MSLLTLSTNQITFEGNDIVKTVQLTNVGGSDMNRKPIMYKIKTNKIDFVDAKPSCGYISGLKGQNQIGVLIRSLAAKKEFSAKLQILYVSHQKITEELVEKNKKHFDLIEYNELYDSIKQGNQNNVKSAIIIVNRKAVDSAQDPPVNPHSDEKGKLRLSEDNTLLKERGSGKYDSIPIEIKKGSSGCSLLLVLMIGVLIGFLLGATYGKDFGIDGKSLVRSIFRNGDNSDVVESGEESLPESVVGDEKNEIPNSGQQGSSTQQAVESQVQPQEQISAENPVEQQGGQEQSNVQVKNDESL